MYLEKGKLEKRRVCNLCIVIFNERAYCLLLDLEEKVKNDMSGRSDCSGHHKILVKQLMMMMMMMMMCNDLMCIKAD